MLRKFKIIYHPSNLKFIKKKFNIFYRIAMCLKHRAIIVLDEDSHTSKEKCTIKVKPHYEPAYSKMKKRASLGNKTSLIRSNEMFDKKPSEIKTNKLAAENSKVDKVPKVVDSVILDFVPKFKVSNKDENPDINIYTEVVTADNETRYTKKRNKKTSIIRILDSDTDTEIFELDDNEIIEQGTNIKLESQTFEINTTPKYKKPIDCSTQKIINPDNNYNN